MAKRKYFYDATKKENRDESWRRWKGGKKLVAELTNFYTNKRVFDRLGVQTPLASQAAAESPLRNMRNNLLGMFLQGRGTKSPYHGLSMKEALNYKAPAAAPDAPLPGRDGPSR